MSTPARLACASLIVAAATLAVPTVARADLSYNVGAVSDYRYRGISQTRLKPAVQGGVDWGNGPVYLGLWASSIKWIKDAGGDASVEIDIYGGYKGEITKDLSYDVGFLTYQYPSNQLNPKADTTEIYGAFTFGPATLKISHSLTNLFGFGNSKGSQYVEASASFDLGGGWTLVPHIGHQSVRNNGAADYTDASLTVTKELAKGLTMSLAAVDARTGAYFGPGGKDLGKRAAVVGIKYAF